MSTMKKKPELTGFAAHNINRLTATPRSCTTRRNCEPSFKWQFCGSSLRV